jgi:DNA-binding protein H-NS
LYQEEILMAAKSKKTIHVSDMENMPLEELVVLHEEMAKLITKKQKDKKKEIKSQMNELAKVAGYNSVEEFIGSQSSKRKDNGVKAPPLYRSPDDPEKTWNGKGRVPNWLKDYEKNGGKRDKLKIK